jgi:hypothetical protein
VSEGVRSAPEWREMTLMGKTIAAVIIAKALAVSGRTYAIARPATVHNVTHAVTRVVREPSAVRTVIKWKTRTVTVTRAVPSCGVTCYETGGAVYLTVLLGAGANPVQIMCTLSPEYPLSTSGVVVTAPDGTSTTYAPSG